MNIDTIWFRFLLESLYFGMPFLPLKTPSQLNINCKWCCFTGGYGDFYILPVNIFCDCLAYDCREEINGEKK